MENLEKIRRLFYRSQISVSLIGLNEPAMSYKLEKSYSEIGRNKSCEMTINEDIETVSRRHAAISITDSIIFSHLGSNPSFVNGNRVERPTELKNGDIIQLAINGPEFKVKISDHSKFDLDKMKDLFVGRKLSDQKQFLLTLGIIFVSLVFALLFIYLSLQNKN